MTDKKSKIVFHSKNLLYGKEKGLTAKQISGELINKNIYDGTTSQQVARVLMIYGDGSFIKKGNRYLLKNV